MKVKRRSMEAGDILSRLKDVVETEDGHYTALCPAHDDHTPSLSITITPEKKVLLKCFSGCSFQEILAAIKNEPVKTTVQSNTGTLGRVIAKYNYMNAAGELAFQVLRYEPKTFRQRRPDGKGGWIYNMNNVSPILYRLPEVSGATGEEPIFVVEGEKDADRLAELGLIATTSPMGAGKWRRIDDSPLHGRRVVVLPDNDDAGVRHAADVVASLRTKTQMLKVVNLPGLAEKGDVSDWLDDGGTKEKLMAIILSTPNVERQSSNESASHGLAVIRMSEVKPEKIQWLWESRIPSNKLTLIVGNPGVGKSFLTTDLAARVSTGKSWPDLIFKRKPGSVIFLSAEDDPADTIRPRLDAGGADVNRIHCIKGLVRPNSELVDMFSLDRDLERLQLLLKKLKHVKLIIIDPVTAYLGRADSNNCGDVRGLLAPLANLASEFRVAVLAISHLNKGQGGMALFRTIGSISFTAAPRAAYIVGLNPDDQEQRLMLPIKMNVGKMPPGIAYRIVDGKVKWDMGEVDMTAETLLNVSAEDGDEPDALEESMQWLQHKLANGPRKTRELQAEARQDGLAWATVRRAKKRLNIQADKQGFGKDSVWSWMLPDQRCSSDV